METTKHKDHELIKKLIEAGNVKPPHLIGMPGTGKSQMLMNIAEELGLNYYSITITNQHGLGSMIGMNTAHGTYMTSAFREAYEKGGLFVIEEINNGDPSLLTILNDIELGKVSFPDKFNKVKKHKDFRIAATSNPSSVEGFSARQELDESTRNRFHEIEVALDYDLIAELTNNEIKTIIKRSNDIFRDNGMNKKLNLRDALELQKTLAILDQEQATRLLVGRLDPVLANEIKKMINETIVQIEEVEKNSHYKKKEEPELDLDDISTTSELFDKMKEKGEKDD
jgi:MoxR-like ATPase